MSNFIIQLSAWIFAFSFIFGLVFAFIFLASFPFWLLWNWLIPPIFGLPDITLIQAFGLWLMVVLVRSTRFNYSKTFGDTKQIIEQKIDNDIDWEELLVSVKKNYRA
tara:strand:- start:344 stop:664 length:321 start_codon:yes stop_codon:yes gene_type:complete